MKLSDADILEFQTLCREQLGLNLTWKQAQEQAISLIRLMQIVYRPITVEEFEAVRKTDLSQVNQGDKDDNRVN